MQAKYAFFMAAGTGLAGFALGVGLTVSGAFNQPAAPSTAPARQKTAVSAPVTPQKMEYGGWVFGRPTNNDGDTLEFRGRTKKENVRVRIFGIDAPESRQTCKAARVQVPCGEQAGDALRTLINGGEVQCRMYGKPTYDRVTTICFADGKDIGREMVLQGWAIDEKEYSEGMYAAEEAIARTAKRGIWAGTFEEPSHWRACNKPLRKGQVRPKDCGL